MLEQAHAVILHATNESSWPNWARKEPRSGLEVLIVSMYLRRDFGAPSPRRIAIAPFLNSYEKNHESSPLPKDAQRTFLVAPLANSAKGLGGMKVLQ
jgi:hypothetical protein